MFLRLFLLDFRGSTSGVCQNTNKQLAKKNLAAAGGGVRNFFFDKWRTKQHRARRKKKQKKKRKQKEKKKTRMQKTTNIFAQNVLQFLPPSSWRCVFVFD